MKPTKPQPKKEFKPQLKDKFEQLQEKYPSDDPLTALYTWTTMTREKVTKALKPYIRIISWSGEVQWLVHPIKEGDQLSQDIELLARATAFELMGADKQYHLENEQAQDLADDIIRVEKNAL